MIYPQNFENKIGYDQIRHLLKERCLSPMGEERVEEMHFSDHFEEVDEWLTQTCEMMAILQGEEEFPAQYYYDVRASLARIRVEGLYLDEQELFDLRRSLETISRIVRFLLHPDEEEMETADGALPSYRYPCLG